MTNTEIFIIISIEHLLLGGFILTNLSSGI